MEAEGEAEDDDAPPIVMGGGSLEGGALVVGGVDEPGARVIRRDGRGAT